MSRHTYQQCGKRRLFATAGRLCLMLCIFSCPPALSTPPTILVIASSDTGPYQRFRTAFTTAIEGSGNLAESLSIHSTFTDDGHLPDASIPPGTGLIVTVGSAAARTVGRSDTAIPVLNTLVPQSVYRSIVQPQPACRRHSAIFIDQPIRRQARLAGLMFPKRKEYGLLLGPLSIKRRPEIDALQAVTTAKLNVMTVGADKSTMAAGRELLRDSELILAINDPLVLSRENAKWLLYVAYQRRLPVIGFSRAYVTAGAAGAVYSTPEQIAQQAAELASAWHTSGGTCLPAAEFPRYFNVAVNRAVSESLGSAMTDEATLAGLIMELTPP